MPDDLSGQLICGNVEQTQLEVGISNNLLSTSFQCYGCLATPSYVSHLWEFLSNVGLAMKDDLPHLSLQRQNNQFLMKVFVEAGLPQPQLKAINRCCLFLHALIVSDIMTGDRTAISNSAWEGTEPCKTTTQYNWPAQGIPSDNNWTLWRQGLQVISWRKLLLQPLGQWLLDARKHRWFFDPTTERLYDSQSPQQYYPRRNKQCSREASHRFDPAEAFPCLTIPKSAMRTIIQRSGAAITISGYA